MDSYDRARARLLPDPDVESENTGRPEAARKLKPPLIDQSNRGDSRCGFASSSVDKVRIAIPGAVSLRLQEFATSQGVTFLTALLSGWSTLLARWSGAAELVVCARLPSHELPDIPPSSGLFDKSHLLRIRLESGLSVSQLLNQVSAAIARAPLDRDIADEPTSSAEESPAFNVLFTLNSDGTLELSPADPEASCGPQMLETLATCLLELLGRMPEDQTRLIAEIPILPVEQWQQVVEGFNGGRQSYPEELIHERFEQQAQRTPQAIAVTYQDQRLPYGELEARANQLARYLKEQGVGPDQRVGLCLERGLDMVVAILGILKVGGAYVPLDPAYPPERLAYILQDCAPPVLLIQESLRARVPQTTAQVIALDTDWPEIAWHSRAKLDAGAAAVAPHHLAYVIYTSGSTGEPKGVMVEHRQVMRLFAATRHQFNFHSQDVWTLFHSFAFDFSVWELWGALLYGGRLVVVPYLTARSPKDFYELLCNEGVTVLNQTPSAFAQLIDTQAHSQGKAHSLRVVIFGGEALELRTLRPWVERHGTQHPQLVNMYGITETTVHVTYRLLSRQEIDGDRGSPIGQPLNDLRLYVLDPHGQPVPIGVVGEIYVGGAGVARGYLNRPELTRERFRSDPFSGDPHARMYKSGDLGRWRADGTLEYLGRNDTQVKIRGFRIELGEIEAQLASHPHVKEAVVLARQDSPGDQKLVGYITLDLTQIKAQHQQKSTRTGTAIVEQWKSLYEETYSEGLSSPSFVGWNSSYTGQPIPEDQMREWRDNTVQRIRSLNPHGILEVGCGVGLLLEKLAPGHRYRGIDVSGEAIRRLRGWIGHRPELQHVELERCAALELHAVPESYDTIILNSVAQYFPDVDYLKAVLEKAASWVSPGGRIFVGDVRHLALLRVFHSSVQLERAAPDVTVEALRNRVTRAIELEKELVIDPRFFEELRNDIPRVRNVRTLLKRGESDNELTRYRYDVVIEIGTPTRDAELERWHWSPGKTSTEEVGERLRGLRQSLRLCGVSNRRLHRDLQAAGLIEESEPSRTAGQLRDALDRSDAQGVDPETLWKLGEDHGYEVVLSWAADCHDGRFDVDFFSLEQVGSADRPKAADVGPSRAALTSVPRRERAYANDPWAASLKQQSVPKLREYLRGQLPAYMVPSALVVIDRFPLTTNGKLDRRALPKPDFAAYANREYEIPEGEVEQILATIWQELLQVERVGRQDNFFELGGHSLLIVQMQDRLRARGLRAHVRSVFESPTLVAMATEVVRDIAASTEIPPNLIPRECEKLTPSMLPLVDLSPQQLELIVAAVPGGARNVKDIYPLAPLQEGILFHHLLDRQGGDTYVLTMLISVSSRETLEQLISAVQATIDRHDILRTAVLWEGLQKPVQVVYAQAILPVEELQLDERRDPVEQLKVRMQPKRQRLALQRAPLLSLQIAQDPGGQQWYALLEVHHIVCDNNSLEAILAEIRAHCEGRAHELPEPVPFRGHVAQTLLQARTDVATTFFRERLSDIEEATAPFGIVNLQGGADAIEEARQSLDRSLASRLRVQARRLCVSVATMFHAAWGIVVSRTSGRDDIVFGTVLLGQLRGSAATGRMLGLFINTLPLRLELRDLSTADLIQHTQRELLDLFGHEQVSLAVAQRCSRIPGSGPLFTALLNYRHSAADSKWDSASGLDVLAIESWTNYPITLSIDDLGEGFRVTAQTDRRIPARQIIRHLHTAIDSLMEALEQTPERLASTLSILPKEEWQQVVEGFNGGRQSYPEELIHERFEQQAQRTPQAIAVTYQDQRLPYGELEARANQLARYLKEQGVGPDQRVGLCLERGLDMVVAILGILKVGGAYVPLDPAYPPERLAYILQDCAPPVLLIQESLRARVPQTTAQVIALDTDWPEIAWHSRAKLDAGAAAVAPHHLAYVIYTSGSTGEPKGVMVEHRQVMRLFAATRHQFNFHSQDVWTLFHSFAFDFSVWELWGALLYGGRLVVVPYLTARSPKDFYELLCNEGVTVLNQTPSAFAQLIDTQAHSQGKAHSLRVVIFGGEALELRTLRPWVERHGTQHPQLVNMYGITETTVHVTYRLLSRQEIDGDRGSPIGQPLNDLRLYVLDPHGQPVPIGVVGEIYVGGAGVARGYLNRPELTRERFRSDPFSGDPHARMYKSGDLGRWRADGTLEYLGRNDTQVKIRGFRIELGEIEAQLARHPQVKEAVVLARQDSPGDQKLVAYLLPADSTAELNAERLRPYLKSVLPDYMVPSAFVTLERFPLTPNGKLDRRALPAPEAAAYARRQYESPQGEVEEILASIWRDLLHVERIGRQDNFFELGGHSLLIVQMMERLRRVGLSAQVRPIFESPNLADLAGTLSADVVGPLEVPPNLIPPGATVITPQMLPLVQLDPGHLERIARAVPGGATNIQDIYPLAPLQEGILFHHLLSTGGGDTYVLPTVLSMSSRERLDQLIVALQAVIDRHDILRTAVLWEHLPRAVQVVYRRATLTVNEVTLQADRGTKEQLQEWMKPERQRVDLRRAPLVRLQVAPDPHTREWHALLRLHHITCDHLTTEAVIAEVIAEMEGRAHGLPESVPYRNHVAQALAYADARDAETFFTTKLGEVCEPTAPFGLLDVQGDGSRVHEAIEALDPQLATRIRLWAGRLGVSPATVFHAAWALVVSQTSGREDVVYGTVLLGRLQGSAGAQRIMGMFINTLPLRLRLQGTTAQGLVEQTQRELVELLGHEQASLAAAQRCSGVAGSTPLFSALLNYRHSVPNPEAEWERLSGVRVLAYQERTNYPITLSVDDLGEGFSLTAQTDCCIDPHRVAAHLRTALMSLVEALEDAPQTHALDLSILPESERHQIADVFNATQAPPPRHALIHQLFEEQVERTPNAPAVMHAGRSLTYAELNRRANQLARYLLNEGAGRDELIGICVERSPEMVVGLLAILKAGSAYVPLDPNYPSERLQYMMEDSKLRLLLTQQQLRPLLPEGRAQVIPLDVKSKEIANRVSENLSASELGMSGSDLVYVIYTSGSTGQPKGTAMPHQAMVNLIEWHRHTFGPGEGCHVLQFAALSFDVAFQEIFSTLCTGATLVLLDEWVRRDALALTELLRNSFIQRLFVPPLMLQSLAECARNCEQLPTTLREVITAGEQLRITPEIVSFFKKLDRCRLHNHYGPTETHVVTALTLEGDPEQWPALPSIGRPIANTQMHVLNGQGQPVPIGVAGELYIGGAGVARGYLGRPELTAQRFIRDPFSTDAKARLYKTGDLGRWQPDGTLEYLGRNDDQVKVRGYRIELGEIEAQLQQHPQVKDAVVIAREDAPGHKRLVAYLTRAGHTDPNIEDLRAHLQGTLPEYMIPSAFVVLESLPVTPSGKLNRRALPAPDLAAYLVREYEPPRGEVEAVLAGIWKEILHLDRVGRHDNFFELGGHSLLAMQLMVRIRSLLSLEAPIRVLFEFPTLSQLATQLEELRQAQLLDDIAAGGEDIEGLLATVAAMPDSAVQELVRELGMRGTP